MITTDATQAKRRATWLASAGLLWAALIGGRLIQLQVVEHQKYRKESDDQVIRQVELRAQRGAFYDRNGRPLALDLPVDSITVNPMQAPEPDYVAGILAPILGLDAADVRTKVAEAAQAHRGFLYVDRKVGFQNTERLRSLRLGWIQFEPDTLRVYPKGSLASHLVGSVDHDGRGNSGLEQSQDQVLRGRPGSARMVTDVVHRGVDSQIRERPVPGKNIILTIDERLQYVAERELAKAVVNSHSKTGSVVVMNPETGEILTIASFPPFDANQPIKPTDDMDPRMNHAVSVPFEPGSVFKVITLAAALETTTLRPETIIPCGNGSINLFGRVIKDHNSYSALSMADVLAKSSNIGAIQIGLRVGPQNLLNYVRRFGFGRKTGIPLPAESTGVVRDLAHWGKTSIGSIAMGHEISTTTIQLAQAISVVANGGRLVRPRLVFGRQRPGGSVEKDPIEPAQPVIRPETAITMRQMMEGVVLNGTGTLARLDGYTAGGKTGSAQIFDPICKCYTHFYNASFAGFAPVAKPAIVVVVTINGASVYGGAVAAPVFREVAATALRLLNVPKDLPEAPPPRKDTRVELTDLAIAGLGSPDPQLLEPAIPGRGEPLVVWGPKIPDFHGKTLQTVMQESARLGVPVDVIGSGIVRAQLPAAGGILARGERVRIQFAR
jgi:cell division protein FtsI (penicillin-binding protein 3)